MTYGNVARAWIKAILEEAEACPHTLEEWRDGLHRLYWSFESLERDFGRIKSSTEPADTTQPAVAQADAESTENAQWAS